MHITTVEFPKLNTLRYIIFRILPLKLVQLVYLRSIHRRCRRTVARDLRATIARPAVALCLFHSDYVYPKELPHIAFWS